MYKPLSIVLLISLAASQCPASAAAADDVDQRIVSLFQEGKFLECLAAIEPLRNPGKPLNTRLLSASAHCKMNLADAQGARGEYTQLLTQAPMSADLWLCRAKCAVAMGSLRDGKADFAIAVQIDPKAAESAKATYDPMLAAAKQLIVSESARELWDQFLTAGHTASDQDLVKLAMKITRDRNARRHVADEDFTRADAHYAMQVRDKPDDVGALLDEATFLLAPTISRDAVLDGKTYTAKSIVHAALPARAEPLLTRALKIEPTNKRAMAQMAQLCSATGRDQQAFDWADKAMEAGWLGVDVCRMHLTCGTNMSDALTSRARALRQPGSRTVDRIENGQRISRLIEVPPSPAALAEADQLDARARDVRVAAITPLQLLINKTQAATADADRITNDLSNAYLSEWRTHYDDAIAWAKKAVDVDPFQSESLLLLEQLCTNMHYEDLAHEAQARLRNAQNPSAGITLDGVWPLMKAGNFAQARKILAQADHQDPGAIELACARFAMAQEENKLDDAVYAARLVSAMNLARAVLNGRSFPAKPPVMDSGADIVLPVYLFTTLGRMSSEAGRTEDALKNFNRAIGFAARVPASELTEPVPDSAVPNDKLNAPAGTYLKAVLGRAHVQAGELLIRANRLSEAAPHLLGAARAGDPTPQLPFMAYRCYKTVGPDGFHGTIPDDWRERFRVWDQQHATVPPLGQITRQTLDLQIDQVTRQINQGVGPDDLRELTAKRAALIARRDKLRSNR